MISPSEFQHGPTDGPLPPHVGNTGLPDLSASVLPTVAEGIAMMNANMAKAQASGDYARILAALGMTVEVQAVAS